MVGPTLDRFPHGRRIALGQSSTPADLNARSIALVRLITGAAALLLLAFVRARRLEAFPLTDIARTALGRI